MRRRIALRIVRLVSISQENNRESYLFKFIALLTARNSLKSEFYSRQYQKGILLSEKTLQPAPEQRK